MALPDERKFATWRRGKVRDDIILSRFRTTLREQINPDTNQPFTEDEIAIITQEDSRFYIEADAIDLYGQGVQQRAIWFADQVRPERAASVWLSTVHGDLWLPEGKLAATGGSGPVDATASPGTIFVGSTVLGDPAANLARAPDGKRYQVLVTVVADAAGDAELQMVGIDPGDDTNLPAGTILTWITPPLGADTEASVQADFTGGFNAETDNEFSQRIVRRIRDKPGSGNSAQFRLWAQQSSNAVQDGFIYPTALHSGNMTVAIIQKRGIVKGPLARIPSIGTLSTTTAYLTPPTSPVVPHNVHVLVTAWNPEPTDMALRLSMPRASSGGWTDADPWPKWSAAQNEGIKIVTIGIGQLSFEFFTDIFLPGTITGQQVTGVSMAIWNEAISEYETLDVNHVVRIISTTHRVVLNSPPSFTAVVGDILSPRNNRSEVIQESFTDYFDELGPSELIQPDDVRFVRAIRHPNIDQEFPTRAGQTVIARLNDSLGGALADAELEFISQNEPTVPTEFEIVNGPNMLVLGKVGIYSFD